LTEKGRRRGVLLILVIFPTCVLFAMSVLDSGFASAEGMDPPETGDWVIRGNTAIDSADIYAPGNITIEANATVHIVNTTLTMNRSTDRLHTLLVEDGAKLFVYGGSILNLDRFEAEPGSAIELEDCEVRTRGEMLLWSQNIFADNVVLKNIAPNAGPDNDGGAALMVLDGSIEGNLLNVDIQNYGGNAGLTSPGQNGSRGGNSILISNVSQWSECTIDCRAGDSKDGGLGIHGTPGGSGGPGANALVRLNCTKFVNTTAEVIASDGGNGARGYSNVNGNGDDGGNGAEGGYAIITLESLNILEMYYVSITSISGNGGSGGNGGDAIDGDGGTAGEGAHAGFSTIEISCIDDIFIEEIQLDAIGGEGGYGGDYGRLEGGVGTFGITRPGGDGGDASIKVFGLFSLTCEDIRATARGGAGLDGGGGYDQGETGGRGGDSELRFHFEDTIEAVDVDLNAIGGQGGPGGPAFSEIEGNGGDGGDATLEFTGLLEMNVEHFSIFIHYGRGGRGRDLFYNGADGIPTLDLDTRTLFMAEGVLNMTLDDLHGGAVAELHNVTFDMEFGIPVLPIGDAVLTTWFPVTVHAVDHADPLRAESLEGYEVTVISIDTGALVAQGFTDEKGKAYFNLQSARYTSIKVDYLGSYYFIVATPDGKRTMKVRGEIQGPSIIRSVIHDPWHMLEIMIEKPVEGTVYRFFSDEDDHLEASGYVVVSDNPVRVVYVQLVPEDGDPDQWPVYKLETSSIHLFEVQDPEDKWGKCFPPDEHGNRWSFFFRFPLFEEEVEYYSGAWLLNITVHTEFDAHVMVVGFDLLLDHNIGKPWVILHTSVGGEIFDGSMVIIEGSSFDDHRVEFVEARIDGGEWEAVGTTEEWIYYLSTGAIGKGHHTIDFRAFDGRQYSDLNSNSFEVQLDDSFEGDGTESQGRPWWETQTFMIVAGMALMVIGLLVGLSLVVMKVRSKPDS
jgi:hypothetical protein